MEHELKTWPEHYQDVVSGAKKVEIRNEKDRTFRVDDTLILNEYDKSNGYTGRFSTYKVTHCLRGLPFVPENHVALSISQIMLTSESQAFGNDCPNGQCS